MNPSSPIETLLAHLRQSLADDSFVSLQFSQPTGQRSGAAAQRVDVRLILLRGQPQLSCTARESLSSKGPAAAPAATPDAGAGHRPAAKGRQTQQANTPAPNRVITRNLPLEEGLAWIREQLGTSFRNAMLRTTRRDWQLHCPAKGESRLIGHKPSTATSPSRQHDESKRTLLGTSAVDWLTALGVSHPNGRPKPSMADKHRQISHYTEILHHLARDCGWTPPAPGGASPLKLADMGCGKGYLTFAAWHLFSRTLHHPVSISGVEGRPELVEGAERIARQLHAEGLQFVQGDIESAPLPALDGLMALHACNTATDDAIRRGIELGATLIVVAPCCHQAVRPELGDPELFAPLLCHGLFKERLAEWLTDGLRTLFLEWAGYQTKAIEFVASEHTPKNLMIAAIRKREPFADDTRRQRILELKQFFGIRHHALDDLLQ